MPRENLMDRIMAEVIIFGGIPVTRHTAVRIQRANGYGDLSPATQFTVFAKAAVEGYAPVPFGRFMDIGRRARFQGRVKAYRASNGRPLHAVGWLPPRPVQKLAPRRAVLRNPA